MFGNLVINIPLLIITALTSYSFAICFSMYTLKNATRRKDHNWMLATLGVSCVLVFLILFAVWTQKIYEMLVYFFLPLPLAAVTMAIVSYTHMRKRRKESLSRIAWRDFMIGCIAFIIVFGGIVYYFFFHLKK